MILSILENTPVWVWVMFCAVISLGLAQVRAREVSRARATLLPVVMMILSLSGALTSFSEVPLALAAWVAGLSLSLGTLAAIRLPMPAA
jgi:hypothetical protein